MKAIISETWNLLNVLTGRYKVGKERLDEL